MGVRLNPVTRLTHITTLSISVKDKESRIGVGEEVSDTTT